MSIKILAIISIIGISYFLLVVIILHFLRRDYDYLQRYISEFAIGPYGFLMVSAFISLAAGSFVLTLGLHQVLISTSLSKVAVALLSIWAVGILMAGMFRTDLLGDKITLIGGIHAIASFLAFFALIPATFIFSNEFMQNAQWLKVYPLAFTLSILITASFALFLYTSFFQQNFAGLGQHLFIITILLWLFLAASHLLKLN